MKRCKMSGMCMYNTVVNYDSNSLPMVACSSNLSGSVAGTNSWAVAGDVTFRAAGVAGALLGLGAVPTDVASARAVVAL